MRRHLFIALALVLAGCWLLWAGLAGAASVGGNYLTKSGGTITGTLAVENDSYQGQIRIKRLTDTGYLTLGGGKVLMLVGAGITQGGVSAGPSSLEYITSSNVYKIWHEANDGAGSTLDADLWKGKAYLDFSATYDPPSLAAGTCSPYQTTTAAGIDYGDFILGSANSNSLFTIRTNALPGQITWKICNEHTTTVDWASMTIYLRAFKR